MTQVLVGPSNQLKQFFFCKLNVTLLRIPTSRRQTSWLFTSVAEKSNSRVYRETNPGSRQSGNWIRDCWIASPTCWPLGHAVSELLIFFLSPDFLRMSRIERQSQEKTIFLLSRQNVLGELIQGKIVYSECKSVFVCHVIKTKNGNYSINRVTNMGYYEWLLNK